MSTSLFLLALGLAPLHPLQLDTCATAAAPRFIPSGSAAVVFDSIELGEDSDHFRIAVATGQRIEIALIFDPMALDLDLRLWNADCSGLLVESASVGGPESLSWSNGTNAPVELVAQVLRAPGAAGSTLFQMELEASQVDCSFSDRYEPNGVCSSAAPLTEAPGDLFLP